MKTSEFITGMAKQCLDELKSIDLNDPETQGQEIIEKYMLRIVVDLSKND